MHVNKRPRIVSYALKTLAGALACAVLQAQAAGLGKLTVLSALGQPLQAEIELSSVASGEAGALVARLASADAYRGANIEFNPTLSSLRFAVEQRAGRQVIRISSSQAVNEPFVDLLLELSWDGGRLVREYTFLLDPPDLRQTQSAQVAAPAAPAAAAPRPQSAARAPADRPAASNPVKPAAAYHVKPGDTLGQIAARLKPADVSLDLMLVALYRANPDAFSGGNMNRLRSGRILALPDPDAIRAATSDAEAKGEVVAHAADFNAYRNKLAAQVALGTATRAPESGQSAAGKISARVEEHATPANESKDQLKLSKAAPGAAAAGTAATAEDRIAKDQQIADATARVKELEKNVSDLERLMAVKAQPARPTLDLSEAKPVPAAKPVAKPIVPAPKKVPAPVPVPEPSWFETLAENLSAIGIVLAVLLAGAAALFVARRRKSAAAGPGIPGESGMPAHTLFDESGGQSVDTGNSVFNSNFSPSASQLDTNEVDPVAEADVYIAYGRDAQAEEILKEALRTQPERHPVRLKLLEIYATRKDARSFETQAGQLYSLTKGSGDEWLQAAALGLSIDPHNPLYAGAEAPAAEPAQREPASAAPVAAEAESAKAPVPVPEAAPNAAPVHAAPDEHPGREVVDVPEIKPEPVDDNFLDFDLGGFSLETPPATVAVAAAFAPAAEPSFDMDFDPPVDAHPAAAPAAHVAAPVQEDAGMDFSLDLPAQYVPVPVTVPVTAPVTVPVPVTFPVPVPVHAAADADVPDPLLDLDMMHFELAPIADAVPAPAPEAVAAAVPEFDLSGIDLDLGAADGADDAMSALQMEMDTKLDLAVAYQEIGDKEGARELIDEVIKGGSAGQMAKAHAIRVQLG